MTDLAQFISAQTHPRQRSSLSGKGKGKGNGRKGWSASNIRNEAERRPEAIPHINKPEPPVLVFGVTPTKVLERIVKEVEKRKTALREIASKGGKVRRIRWDQHVLVSGVVSYPVDWKSLRPDPDGIATYANWKKDVVEFLRDHYAKVGGELVGVVEHIDEPYPHLHFYVLPVASPTFAAREVEDGWRLKLEARAARLGKPEEDAAAKRGKTILQDALYVAVSQKYGHLRHKEKRPRLARNIYMSEKRELDRKSHLIAKAREIADENRDEAVRKVADLEIRLRELGIANEELNSKNAEVDKLRAEIERRDAASRMRERDLANALERAHADQRKAAGAQKRAAVAEAAFREAAKDIVPRAQTTLTEIKSSIRELVKVRDRYRQPQNPAEARSFAAARSAIEALERTALAFDTFICANNPVPDDDPASAEPENEFSLRALKPDEELS